MRVAVIHDWLVGPGGAERVTLELLRTFNADLFALVDHLGPEDRERAIGGHSATTSYIQRLPFSAEHFRWYLPLFAHAMEQLNLAGYDLIISSSYAVAKGVRVLPGQKHICYIHTPMRYAWVDTDGYLSDHGVQALRARLIRWQMQRFRAWDRRVSARVDRFVANSAQVAARVQQAYGRPADVLFPPVDGERFRLSEEPRSGYLTVSRLVPYKRVDRIIRAFNTLPDHRLTVVGDGPELVRLQQMAGGNVHFAGALPDERLVALLGSARALVSAAHEDLGLTPLEAMACGTPVIALRAGGHLETVPEQLGCTFFDRAEPEHIRDAILRCEARVSDLSPLVLREQASQAFTPRFRERMLSIAEEVMSHA